MSGKISGMVWDLDLPHAQMLVLLAMTDHADHEGRNIFPSIGLIAWKCGYSERQVQRIIKELVELRILVVQAESTANKPTTYSANLAAAPKKAPYTRGRGDKMSPDKMSGVTFEATRGDMHVSPEPSYRNVNKSIVTRASALVTQPAEGKAERATGQEAEDCQSSYLTVVPDEREPFSAAPPAAPAAAPRQSRSKRTAGAQALDKPLTDLTLAGADYTARIAVQKAAAVLDRDFSATPAQVAEFGEFWRKVPHWVARKCKQDGRPLDRPSVKLVLQMWRQYLDWSEAQAQERQRQARPAPQPAPVSAEERERAKAIARRGLFQFGD